MSPVAEVALNAQREIRKNVRSAMGDRAPRSPSLAGSSSRSSSASLEWAKKRGQMLASYPAGAWSRAHAPDHPEARRRRRSARRRARGRYPGPCSVRSRSRSAPGLARLSRSSGSTRSRGSCQHRTVRYWTVRTRRVSFSVGKVLGLWAVVSALTLLVHVLIWGIIVQRGESAGAVVEMGAAPSGSSRRRSPSSGARLPSSSARSSAYRFSRSS